MRLAKFSGRPCQAIFLEKQIQVTYIIKKICNIAESSWNLLQIYKNNYFTCCTQKTAIAIATNMQKKNIFCSIVGGWYKELKAKEFCVFDYKSYYRATIF